MTFPPSTLLFDIGGELITVDTYMTRHGVEYFRAIHEINKLVNARGETMAKTKTADKPATQETVQVQEAPSNLPAVAESPHGNITYVPAPKPAPVYPPKIAKAILAVQRAFGHVGKAGKNDFQGYKYPRWEDVNEKLSPLLSEHGLVMVQSEVTRSILEKSDKGSVLGIVYRFTLVDAETGDSWPEVEWTAIARLSDQKGVADDKAAAKAHTQAEKYFSMKAFKIRTEDEKVIDSDADDGKGKGKTEPELPSEPHQIVVKSGGAKAWAALYILAIERSTTRAQLDAWALANAETTGKIGKLAKDGKDDAEKGLALAIHKAFQARYSALPEETAQNGAQPAAQPAQRPLPPRVGQPRGPTNAPAASAGAAPQADHAPTAAASPDGFGDGKPDPTSSAQAAATVSPPKTAAKSAEQDPADELAIPDNLRRWTKEQSAGWVERYRQMVMEAPTAQDLLDLQTANLNADNQRKLQPADWQIAVEVTRARFLWIEQNPAKIDYDKWIASELSTALKSAGTLDELDDVKQRTLIPSRDALDAVQWKLAVKMFRERLGEIDPDAV